MFFTHLYFHPNISLLVEYICIRLNSNFYYSFYLTYFEICMVFTKNILFYNRGETPKIRRFLRNYEEHEKKLEFKG
jgi:hypothetical protein